MDIPEIDAKVIDSEGFVGIVKDNRNMHNIFVEYENNSGQGYYCIVPDCKDYDPLFLCE